MSKKQLQQEIDDTKKELGDAAALDSVANTQGGKKLVEGFVADIIGHVETLCAKHKTLTHLEFITICIDMKNKYDVVKALRNAKNNRVFLSTELKKLLKKSEDMPDDEEDDK